MFDERDAWRYEPPYDFYDSDGWPVKNPEFFFAARDDDGALIGFYFLEPRDGALFYGFGMRPDLTGRGLGEQFVLAGLELARVLYGAHRVVLDVAAFNERAIRLYRRLGFAETSRHVEDIRRLRGRGVHRHGKARRGKARLNAAMIHRRRRSHLGIGSASGGRASSPAAASARLGAKVPAHLLERMPSLDCSSDDDDDYDAKGGESRCPCAVPRRVSEGDAIARMWRPRSSRVSINT